MPYIRHTQSYTKSVGWVLNTHLETMNETVYDGAMEKSVESSVPLDQWWPNGISWSNGNHQDGDQ